MAKRNLRQKPRISYYEPDEPNLDEYVFCEKCGDFVYEYCSIHGALLVIPDDKVPSKTNLPSFVPRAALTIPHVFLHLAPSIIPGAGLGVFSTLTLPCGVRFGPYRGQRSNEISSMYCWQMYDQNQKPSHVIDAEDTSKSNWMRYVNCARHWREQNLVAYQYQGQLYYRTIKIVPRFTELMVFYGSEFANLLHIDLKKYNSPTGYAQKFGAPPTAAKKHILDMQRKDVSQEKHSVAEKKEKPVIKTNKPIRIETNLMQSIPTIVRPRNKIKLKKQKINTAIIDIKPSSHTKPIITRNTEHTNTHNAVNNDVKSYKCVVCRFEFCTESSLTMHKCTREVETLHCDICNNSICYKKGSCITNTSTQYIGIQSGEKPYKCTPLRPGTILSQSNSYSDSSSLKDHLRLNRGERPYKCNICAYKCSVSSSLKTHLRIHSGEKPYKCNVCDYKFSQSSNLKTHLRIHSGEKPYICNICDYKCSHSGHLKTHLRIHSGEKPYICNICDYKCSHSGNLKTHLRIHSGEKPCKCNVCDYKCSRRDVLKIHLRIHSGEKPYKCEICDYKCNQIASLKRHLLKIHLQ